jgi:D-arabinose 1-dehydrogenase-like Zn-dependent alcohol dehydrogenase
LKTRLLYTTGAGAFREQIWEKPEISSDQIEVRAVMTGVCRSDIDMMQGNFGPLPLEMQGHEGIGQVTKVGSMVTGVKEGDYVATRGEPAYADYYNVRQNEFVIVPEAHPRYILEPVACGINVVTQSIREIAERGGEGKRLLIKGSGFLAWIAYHTIKLNHLDFEVDVVGSSNQDLWGDILLIASSGTYDVIIDLSERNDIFDTVEYNDNALIIIAAQKKPRITTDFGNFLWKAVTVSFPSPRNPKFINAMRDAEFWISTGAIDVDRFWTKGYARNTEWQEAFADGVNRPEGYSRGYIVW